MTNAHQTPQPFGQASLSAFGGSFRKLVPHAQEPSWNIWSPSHGSAPCEQAFSPFSERLDRASRSRLNSMCIHADEFQAMFRSMPKPESYALSVRLDAFDAGVIKARGAILTVLFSERSTPPLCIGERVKLRFLDGGSLHGREASARVTSWRDRGIHREVEFRMRPEIVTLAAAGMGLRDDFRVVPNPADRLVAKLRRRGQTEWRRALLKDLSLTGIGVLVNSETDEALVETSLLEVEIELPGQPAALPFIGRIRSRGIAGCAIRHGIEIVPELTEAHSFLEDCLRAYSRQRQRELLEASRNLNDAMDESETRRSA